MEQLTAEEVRSSIRNWLGDDSIVEVSRDDPGGRITGWIMHPRFTGLSHSDRQAWLWNGSGEAGELTPWKGLKGTFQARSSQIGLILTYSPAEYENAFDESA